MDRRKRARTAVAAGGQAPAAKKVAVRPTEDEEHAAERIIALCREVALEPPLVVPRTRPEARVVACGLALYFGEKFASEAKAKEAFGVGASTEVRKLWVADKLVRLFEAKPAAREAAAAYFAPNEITHEDDAMWNDAALLDAEATAACEPEPQPRTALDVLAATSSSEVRTSDDGDADAAYERGLIDGKKAMTERLEKCKAAGEERERALQEPS